MNDTEFNEVIALIQRKRFIAADNGVVSISYEDILRIDTELQRQRDLAHEANIADLFKHWRARGLGDAWLVHNLQYQFRKEQALALSSLAESTLLQRLENIASGMAKFGQDRAAREIRDAGDELAGQRNRILALEAALDWALVAVFDHYNEGDAPNVPGAADEIERGRARIVKECERLTKESDNAG